jgi:hypothetical protein
MVQPMVFPALLGIPKGSNSPQGVKAVNCSFGQNLYEVRDLVTEAAKPLQFIDAYQLTSNT